MASPIPKDPKLRQNRNKHSTEAQLIDGAALDSVDGGEIPDLPPKFDADGVETEWLPQTAAYWKDIWTSPMRTEYTLADYHRMVVYIDAFDRYWRKPNNATAAELRLQGVSFGLTPIDRRRLQWEIKRSEPKGRKEPPKKPESGEDPRQGLRAV